jgi:hypothetical protein
VNTEVNFAFHRRRGISRQARDCQLFKEDSKPLELIRNIVFQHHIVCEQLIG